MKIIVLNENFAGLNYRAEHGLSYLIKADKEILFDTGSSDLFLINAKKLGININKIDTIVLSHGHWDHGNGLMFLKNKNLICHPDCFIKRYRKKDKTYVGIELSLEEAHKRFVPILSKNPYKISKDITFLGEIPRVNNFESKSTPFQKENNIDDFVMDDSAVFVKSEKGLIIITGCSHSGICNIIEHAKKVSGINNVYAVIGGFHLKTLDEITNKTIEYLKNQKIKHILPSHCTGFPVLSKFNELFNSKIIKSGDIIEF
ncbi:MAG: MBL fold metallo-hydrolase [Bacteroidales bacterium]|nr:MBL fold metallo-hydrolase [Bacteroidales bacterium]